MSSKLIQLENTFQDFLLHKDPTIFEKVIGTSKVPIETRLGIYQHAYHARLHDALCNSYPALQCFLGEEEFQTLCYTYIDCHPSPFRSIRWFGHQLSTFLEEHPSYKLFPYLSELARFEWTMSLVFDAVDSPLLTAEDIQVIAPEEWMNMRLSPHPSVHRLTFSWNVVAIWQAFMDEKNTELPQENHPHLNWVLWRTDFMSQFSSLTIDEAWAIDALINHATFGEICEGLCQWIEEEQVGIHAASLLKSWITGGLLSGVGMTP